ncbi:hypothetical protein [Acetobacter tropicalis]|uniref:hypothetical protein n=1 Tax=Acetobacter tropicalis TaxID=104102 RepID=UPI001592EDE2|nr:hypothetical protein [Acetobacter tropicalis]
MGVHLSLFVCRRLCVKHVAAENVIFLIEGGWQSDKIAQNAQPDGMESGRRTGTGG